VDAGRYSNSMDALAALKTRNTAAIEAEKKRLIAEFTKPG
jgi:hypothetical protein